MAKCVAVKHVGFEDLGAFHAALEARGYHCDMRQAGIDPLDDLENADLLIILGGPIGVNDVASYPFLKQERALIEARLRADRPLMGICLGAQLIAQAAGARVAPGRVEIGFSPITLTESGRRSCLSPFADDPMTLHWHGDRFDLPAGARRLASTPFCENQAFDLGPRVIGFQFHPEADARRLEPWLIGHAVELQKHGVSPAALRAEADAIGDRLALKGRTVVGQWLDGLADGDT